MISMIPYFAFNIYSFITAVAMKDPVQSDIESFLRGLVIINTYVQHVVSKSSNR